MRLPEGRFLIDLTSASPSSIWNARFPIFMKDKSIISVAILFSLAGAFCLLNSCISAIGSQIVGQQIRHMGDEALTQGEKKWDKATRETYTRMMHAAAAAQSAKVSVSGGLLSKVRKSDAFAAKDYILPPDELGRLKEIMLRSKEVPQARRLVSIHPKVKRSLLLFDASGKFLDSIDYPSAWKRESALKESNTPYSTASWYLPDADYDALRALPTLRAADTYSAQVE